MTYDGSTLSDYSVTTSYGGVAPSTGLISSLSTVMSTVFADYKSSLSDIEDVTGRVLCAGRGGVGIIGSPPPIISQSERADRANESLLLSMKILEQYGSSSIATESADMNAHARKAVLISSGNSNVHQYGYTDRSVVTNGGLSSDQDSWIAGESVLDRAHEVTLQDDEQSHRGTENGYVRTQRTTLQNDRQSWIASESLLDRTAETNLQDAQQVHLASEAAYKRTAQSTLQSDQFSWESSESLLDRGQATTLQDDEQTHRGTEAGYARTQKTTLQNDRQSWESAESLLDRTAETDLQNTEQAHLTSEAAYARSVPPYVASVQHLWEAAQSVLDRSSDTSLQDDEQTHASSEAVLARAQKQTISSDQLAWELIEAGLDSTHKEDMLLKQLRLDFLAALVGQIANETLPSRMHKKTGSSAGYYSVAVNFGETPSSYLSTNRFPLLWNSDGTLSEPTWGSWRSIDETTDFSETFQSQYYLIGDGFLNHSLFADSVAGSYYDMYFMFPDVRLWDRADAL